MTSKSPSNPSPYSSELQTFIVTKYDPLLAIVRELNDRLQVHEKEKFRLERRINRLETNLLSIKNFLENEGEGSLNIEDSFQQKPNAVKELMEAEEALSAPWLFSCQIGTPLSSLQVLLEFTPYNTEELDAKFWKREEDMWINFLEELPEKFIERKVDSLQLSNLRSSARRALLEICRGSLLLVLRNVPGKIEAPSNPTSITLVAILASGLSEAWTRVEASDPTALGRIALVLEGHQIGSRLRAGRKRFYIEPLN